VKEAKSYLYSVLHLETCCRICGQQSPNYALWISFAQQKQKAEQETLTKAREATKIETVYSFIRRAAEWFY